MAGGTERDDSVDKQITWGGDASRKMEEAEMAREQEICGQKGSRNGNNGDGRRSVKSKPMLQLNEQIGHGQGKRNGAEEQMGRPQEPTPSSPTYASGLVWIHSAGALWSHEVDIAYCRDLHSRIVQISTSAKPPMAATTRYLGDTLGRNLTTTSKILPSFNLTSLLRFSDHPCCEPTGNCISARLTSFSLAVGGVQWPTGTKKTTIWQCGGGSSKPTSLHVEKEIGRWMILLALHRVKIGRAPSWNADEVAGRQDPRPTDRERMSDKKQRMGGRSAHCTIQSILCNQGTTPQSSQSWTTSLLFSLLSFVLSSSGLLELAD
ncbi:hypothetical protein QBC42DRAFT_312286 [Cladorrhinum samala]|uniref:Uncharacterized protein n=1 Tax=Cladorrhinum samala TaxID=585594 RepID=A0AAV9HFE8_9PEZI|nr:hypothetical protein QBC42DRAFT_312286 [Cladorrhinum samala]